MTDDIERRKTYFKLNELTGDIRDFIDGFYDLDPAENNSPVHDERGILFGDIYISNPTAGKYMVTPPKAYFRYLTSEQRPSPARPLQHEFTMTKVKSETGTERTIDYGFFNDTEENLSKFKELYQHLSHMQINYDIYVKLDDDLFNGRTYKWKVMQQYDMSASS